MRSHKVEDIFKHNKVLVEKKLPNKLHFVCLEGACGTGKAEIIRRTEKMGYKTTCFPFYQHALDIVLNHSIPPAGAISVHLWATKLIESMNFHTKMFSNGVPYKENTVFVHRSLFTPIIYGHTQYEALLKEIRNEFSVSLICCYSDPIRQAERIGERAYWAKGAEIQLRDSLENEEKVRFTTEMYEYFEQKSYFDALLPSTSSKQATCHLLSMCGIEFDPDNLFNPGQKE